MSTVSRARIARHETKNYCRRYALTLSGGLRHLTGFAHVEPVESAMPMPEQARRSTLTMKDVVASAMARRKTLQPA